MNAVKNYFIGEPSVLNAKSSAESDKVVIQSDKQSQSTEQSKLEQSKLDLVAASNLVNQTKTDYDSCEARRMQAVMNGKDSTDYSCEREFSAFKKAFDIQLMIESKIPLTVQVPATPH